MFTKTDNNISKCKCHPVAAEIQATRGNDGCLSTCTEWRSTRHTRSDALKCPNCLVQGDPPDAEASCEKVSEIKPCREPQPVCAQIIAPGAYITDATDLYILNSVAICIEMLCDRKAWQVFLDAAEALNETLLQRAASFGDVDRRTTAARDAIY
ncbi:hypothetical protein ACROYT_G040365 [Oculina patagonica]